MTSYLVFISCLLDMNKKSTTEKKKKNEYIWKLEGKENQILDPLLLWYPNQSPCYVI